MKENEFMELVRKMRKAQKRYALLHHIGVDRKLTTMLAMNELQTMVDSAIEDQVNILKEEEA